MPQYEIHLGIEPEVMMCDRCDVDILGTLIDFLTKKQYPHHIEPNFLSHKVKITVAAKDKKAAEDLALDIENYCSAVGREVIKGSRQLVDLSNQRLDLKLPALTDPATKQPPKQWQWFVPVLALTSGMALMANEHYGFVPRLSHNSQTYVDVATGAWSTLLTLIVGKPYFLNAFHMMVAKQFLAGAMEKLISLGSILSLIYSFLLTLKPELLGANHSEHPQFALPLVMLGLLKLSHDMGRQLEAQIKKTKIDLTDRMLRIPRTALVEKDGATILLPIENVPVGSIVHVERGEVAPLDGQLLSKSEKNTQDESKEEIRVKEINFGKKGLTTKRTGEMVYAGSVNESSSVLQLSTTHSAAESKLKQDTRNLSKGASRNPLLDGVMRWFFPGVLLIASASAIGWGIKGQSPVAGNCLRVFINVVLAACPCAIGLIEYFQTVCKTVAHEHGLAILSNDVLSGMNQVTDVAFDKCGTLTKGNYEVWKVFLGDGNEHKKTLQNEHLIKAALVEQQFKKRGAIADAIINEFKQKKLDVTSFHCSDDFKENLGYADRGRGASRTINNKKIVIGNQLLMENNCIAVDESWKSNAAYFESKGKLPLFMAEDGKLVCLLVLKEAEEEKQILRPKTASAVHQLLAKGITIHIITGDSEERTKTLVNQKFGANANIIIHARQSPAQKVEIITALKQQGKIVAMVEDDDNGTPAVQAADFGMAIDWTAAVKKDAKVILNGSADGVLKLMKLSSVYRVGKALLTFTALAPPLASLIFATGIFELTLNYRLDPMVTAISMPCSYVLLMAMNLMLKKIATLQLQSSSSGSCCRGMWSCCPRRSGERQRLLAQDASESQMVSVVSYSQV